jgi:hypothetical protein
MSRLGGWLVIEIAKAQYYIFALAGLFFGIRTLTDHILIGGWDNIVLGILLGFFAFSMLTVWGRIVTESILSIIQIRDRLDVMKHRKFDNVTQQPLDVLSSPIIAWLLSESHGSRQLKDLRTPSQDPLLFTILDEDEEEQQLRPTRAQNSSPQQQPREFVEIELRTTPPAPHPRAQRRSMSVSDVYRPESVMRMPGVTRLPGEPGRYGYTGPIVNPEQPRDDTSVSPQVTVTPTTSTARQRPAPQITVLEADWPPSPPSTPTSRAPGTPQTPTSRQHQEIDQRLYGKVYAAEEGEAPDAGEVTSAP